MFLWAGFLLCSAVIVYSGTRLSKYGDVIAAKTGLGRVWVGFVLLASATSLPELVTGLSSVTYADAPNIAIGDVLGSCVFNLLIIAVLDAFFRLVPLSAKAHQGNILSACFGILLLGLAAAGIILGGELPVLGFLSPLSLVFVFAYVLAVRLTYLFEKKKIADFAKEAVKDEKYREVTLRQAYFFYGLNALVVIAAAILLPGLGKGIAEATGLGSAFVGNVFVAVSTSFPELVVCLAAIRMDAVDLAIGNLFGSNIFNIFILALDDFFYFKGSLLAAAEPSQVIPALSAILMTAIAVIGLTYRASRKRFVLSWDSLSIILIYVLNVILLFRLK